MTHKELDLIDALRGVESWDYERWRAQQELERAVPRLRAAVNRVRANQWDELPVDMLAQAEGLLQRDEVTE